MYVNRKGTGKVFCTDPQSIVIIALDSRMQMNCRTSAQRERHNLLPLVSFTLKVSKHFLENLSLS